MLSHSSSSVNSIEQSPCVTPSFISTSNTGSSSYTNRNTDLCSISSPNLYKQRINDNHSAASDDPLFQAIPLQITNPGFKRQFTANDAAKMSNNSLMTQQFENSFHSAINPQQTIFDHQPRCVKTTPRRTISLQTVGLDYFSGFGTKSSSLIDESPRFNVCLPPLFDLASFPSSHSICEHSLHISAQNVSVMDWLHEVALNKLTRMFSQYSEEPTNGSNRWYKRIQMMDNLRTLYKHLREKAQNKFNDTSSAPVAPPPCNDSLYGLPLSTVQANTANGSPLPRFVHDLMDYIDRNVPSADGIFRKNGVKVRIQEIHDCCARLSATQPIPAHLLSGSQPHDIADALKQYFREMPECLMTDHLTETLESMVIELPEENHFAAFHYCMLLLPSEHREALVLLLRFLNRITRHSDKNQMTATNMATCWMPTLFRFACAVNNNDNFLISSRLTRRKTIGMPNDKERKAYEAVKRVLTKMIEQWDRLLHLPNDLVREIEESKLDVCHDLEMSSKNGQLDFTEQLQLKFRGQLFRLREADYFSWNSPKWRLQRVFPDGSHLFTQTINDMVPLKLFRVQTSIAASPNLILHQILHNREIWDTQVSDCKRVGPSGQNFDILKVTYKKLIPEELEKCAYLARLWSYGELNGESVCSLMERSIVSHGHWQDHSRGISVYKSEFLIRRNSSGHSIVNYTSRADFRGRGSLWYEKVYGEMLVQHIQLLKQNMLRCQNSRLMGGIFV